MASLMGSSYIKYSKEIDKDVQELAVIIHEIFPTTSKLEDMPVKLAKMLNLPAWKKFESTMKNSIEKSTSFVDKYLDKCSDDSITMKVLGEKMDRRTLLGLFADFVLAAGDTTALTNQWALYNLSLYPKIQDELRKQSSMVKSIIRETLRLYPAAPFITRLVMEEVEVLGYKLPPGVLALLSLYSIGRNPKIFPSPEQFNPHRWTRDSNGRYTGVNDLMAYMPFAIGVRSCIGRKLAEAQMSSTLQKVVDNFSLSTSPEVGMVLRLVPAPDRDVKIKISMRN